MDNAKGILKICGVLDNGIIRIGEIFAWLNGILLVVIIAGVILRYIFNMASQALEELQWHLYSVNVVLGLGFALAKDSHIRLDIFRVHFSERTKQKIEIFGIIFMLFPFIGIYIINGFDFWLTSWQVREISMNPSGLPCRYIIKALIPLSGGFLAVAALSCLFRAITCLYFNDKTRDKNGC